MTIISIVLLIVCLVLMYIIQNLLRKNESYELTLGEIYDKINLVLITMRILDNRQMFESDDEVGEVYNQISDIVKFLSTIIIEKEIDEIQENRPRNEAFEAGESIFP